MSKKTNNTMGKIATLRDVNQIEQAIIVGQLCRNQFAIDYALGVLSNLKQRSEYKGRLKQLCGRFEAFADAYNKDLNVHSKAYGKVEEIVRDAAYEFGRYAKQNLEFYKQAEIRFIQMMKVPDANFIAPITVAKDLLGICGFINGLECTISRQAQCFRMLGGATQMVEGQEQGSYPTSMGYGWAQLRNLLSHLLKERGIKNMREMVVDVDQSHDAGRALYQCSEKLTEALQWHTFFWVLCTNKDITMEEAIEKAKALDKELEAMRDKELRKKALKEAKKNSKNETNG